MNSDLNKQAQALEVTFSRKTKSYHSLTCFKNILRIYLNGKFNFYHHIIAEMLTFRNKMRVKCKLSFAELTNQLASWWALGPPKWIEGQCPESAHYLSPSIILEDLIWGTNS